MDKVTLVVTSCARFDLLVETLESFFQVNTHPIERMLIHEDSGQQEMFDKISDRYGDRFDIIFPKEQRGYSRALDRLFSEVKTDYVFTTEDDWRYYKNPGFIERSLLILKENPHIHQVWIRDHFDHNHPLTDPEIVSGIRVRGVTYGYRNFWNGFSLNPGLRRMADIQRMFPNGMAEYGDEIECAKHVARFKYKAVSLDESTIRHIGWNRHTPNFKV